MGGGGAASAKDYGSRAVELAERALQAAAINRQGAGTIASSKIPLARRVRRVGGGAENVRGYGSQGTTPVELALQVAATSKAGR